MKSLAPIAIVCMIVSSCDVSQDEEVAIGTETAQQVNTQLPIVLDPYITSYINELGDTIASHTSRADLDWHFHVVNSHQINAFALPGGYVYVNRGLIEATSRVDELAGVLAHEIGHVIQRHSVEQMKDRQKIGVVAELACTLTRGRFLDLAHGGANHRGRAGAPRHDPALDGPAARSGWSLRGHPPLHLRLSASAPLRVRTRGCEGGHCARDRYRSADPALGAVRVGLLHQLRAHAQGVDDRAGSVATSPSAAR